MKIKKVLGIVVLLLILVVLIIIVCKKILPISTPSVTKQNKIILNEKQLKFKQTLEDMKAVLDKNKIHFFLAFGTALGAHREKKFIEHDHDIDIGVFDYNKSLFKIKTLLDNNKKFKLIRNFPKNKNLKEASELTYIHTKTKVLIDIFKFVKDGEQFFSYTYGGPCNKKKGGSCVYKDPVNLMKINFLGKIYNIPKKNFLVSRYGSNWKKEKKYGYFEGVNKEYKSLINKYFNIKILSFVYSNGIHYYNKSFRKQVLF